jgi:CO/xanthine dehydrogenase Mo-binding subunit
MADIVPFLKGQSAFEPEATRAMSAAVDEICRALGVTDGDLREREIIATRIFELARRGELNAHRLRDRVLREAGAADAKVPPTLKTVSRL